jgi:hypothetical protein
MGYIGEDAYVSLNSRDHSQIKIQIDRYESTMGIRYAPMKPNIKREPGTIKIRPTVLPKSSRVSIVLRVPIASLPLLEALGVIRDGLRIFSVHF